MPEKTPTAGAESLMASLNVPARSMTQTARTAAVGQRAPRATTIVQTVPAVRERVIRRAGVEETVLQAVPGRLAEAPLQEKPAGRASRADPGISNPGVTLRCRRGGLAQIVRRVRTVRLVRIVRLVKNVRRALRMPRASVRRKRQPSAVTRHRVQRSVLRTAHVRWRVRWKIPVVTAMQAIA